MRPRLTPALDEQQCCCGARRDRCICPAERKTARRHDPPRVALDDIPPRAKSPGATVSLGDGLIITGPIFTTTHKRLGDWCQTAPVAFGGLRAPSASLLVG